MLDACCGTPAVSRSDKPIGQAPADHERGKGRNEICTCRQRLKLSHRCLSSQIWICMAANAGYRSKGKRTACVSHQCVRWEGQKLLQNVWGERHRVFHVLRCPAAQPAKGSRCRGTQRPSRSGLPNVWRSMTISKSYSSNTICY